VDAATIISTSRRRAGITQRELARRAGTSAAAICLYESGQRQPRVDTLTRVVASCGGRLDVQLAPPSTTIDLAANARRLEAVLELAAHLPSRPSPQIDGPVFAHLARA
jgi:transcriptional regulator with XRE-family HTH domain